MDLTDRLDPAIAAALAGVDLPPLTDREHIAALRGQRLLGGSPRSDRVERTDHLVPGLGSDDPPVPVRVHRPRGHDGPLPCVVSLHGGGYILGTYEDDDVRHDRWAPSLAYVGVAVEYRLAPATPYPGPLDDSYAALSWVHRNTESLGIDPGRLGVLGASAGGGLAAALALVARDRGEITLAFQQLIYPMIDDRAATTTSRWPVPLWGPDSNALGWSCYLGARYGTDDVPAYAAPARATDLAGLPPTFLATGALDGFCDETIDYGQRLNHAGVAVELHVYPGVPHGFDMLVEDAEISRRCVRDQEEWLAGQLGVAATPPRPRDIGGRAARWLGTARRRLG